jgi:hypothetical protein
VSDEPPVPVPHLRVVEPTTPVPEPRTVERPVRASDAERQAVADRLNTAVGEGRLTLEEFSDRVAGAYAARTHAELEVLVQDLPLAPLAIVADTRPVVAAPRVAVGPMKLDLRGADLAAHEVTLSARTVIGAIKVWVPGGLRVEVEGTTAIGTRTIAESNLPPDVAVPTLRLRLDTTIGTVKVYRT